MLFRSNYEPLGPITGKDEEWTDVSIHSDTKETWYQNKRCSALFKDGKDGKPYYINAIVKRDQRGINWSGRAWLNEEDWLNVDRTKMIDKRGYVKSFPFTPMLKARNPTESLPSKVLIIPNTPGEYENTFL